MDQALQGGGQVAGYLDLEPTIGAHRGQRNQDPFYYWPFRDDAIRVVNTVTVDGQDPSDCSPDPGDSADSLVWPVGKNAPHGAVYRLAGPYWANGHHTGYDFNPPTGTAVHAAHSGTVTEPARMGGHTASRWSSPGNKDRTPGPTGTRI